MQQMNTPQYIVRLGRAPLIIAGASFSSASIADATHYSHIGTAIRAAIEVNNHIGEAKACVERVNR